MQDVEQVQNLMWFLDYQVERRPVFPIDWDTLPAVEHALILIEVQILLLREHAMAKSIERLEIR